MILSIIIPCYNEVETIADVVRAVKDSPVKGKEIIVVDDCSTDGTREVLNTQIESLVDKVIYHEQNRGKGAAIRTGIKAATGDIIIIQDADLEYDPNDYPKVIGPIVTGQADVVFGSRFLLVDGRKVVKFRHKMVNKFLTILSNFCSNLDLTDMETCYKAFRSDVIKSINIEENRFGFEPEITAKIAKIPGLRIYEVAISYHGRSRDEGKKIGWKDGLRAIYCILKYNFFTKALA